MIEYHPHFCKSLVETTSIWSKSLTRYIPWICVVRGENLEWRHNGRRHWRIGQDGRIRNLRQKAQCKGSVNADERWKFHIPSRRWNSQDIWRTSTSENIHLNPGSSRTRRGTRSSSRRIRRALFSNSTSRRLNKGWCGRQKWFLVYYRRFHVSPSRGSRVKLYVPREESFLIPMKYIDVTRNTHTSLDVMLEKNKWHGGPGSCQIREERGEEGACWGGSSREVVEEGRRGVSLKGGCWRRDLWRGAIGFFFQQNG